MNKATDAYTEMMGEWQNLMMENWGAWTKATVNSEAFAHASSAMMDWNLASQNKMRELTGQYLEAVDLPRRSDLARLSEQVLSVEKRLADGEDERDELKEQLDGIESKLSQILNLLQQQPAASPAAAVEAAEVAAKPKAKATKAKSKTKAKTKTATAKKTTNKKKS